MRKVTLHIKRLFRKFWFYIFFMFVPSPILGIANLLIMMVISMLFFSDPIEPIDMEEVIKKFTEGEQKILNSPDGTDPEEYLSLLGRYLTLLCPNKVDPITTWVNVEVKKEAFIYNYVIDDKKHKYGDIDMSALKERIMSSTFNSKDYDVKCLVATNRNMVFRYKNNQTKTIEDIIIYHNELKELIEK